MKGGTPATVVCERAGVTHRLLSYEVASPDNYGLAAAAALSLDPSTVFKTLIALVDDHPTVAIVPVDRQCSLKALAHAVGGRRAEMAAPPLAERLTGYVVGGISPLGQKRQLPTVIDESAILLDAMYVSAGRRGLQMAIAPDDLVALTSGMYAVIAI